MALTDVTIASRALVLMGANPISDFDQGTTESIVANNIYESIVEAALTRKRWRFAVGQSEIFSIADKPKGRWETAFALPGDPAPIQINAVTVNDSTIVYDRYENYIYTNATSEDTVILDYAFRAPVANWLPYFTKAVTLELASYFSGALAQNSSLMATYMSLADSAYTIAGTIEAQSQTTRNVKSRKLITVRR